MKLTTKKLEISQFYVKSIFKSLFLKVPVITTSLRSLGSLFQQVALCRQKIIAQFSISADLSLYYIAYFCHELLIYV